MQVRYDLVEIDDIAVHYDRKDAMTGGEHHRLDVVADDADPILSLHFFVVLLKFGPEIFAANIVNLALNSLVSANGHARVIRAKVAMIIDAIIKRSRAIASSRRNPKNNRHSILCSFVVNNAMGICHIGAY